MLLQVDRYGRANELYHYRGNYLGTSLLAASPTISDGQSYITPEMCS